jgi:GNAT superfamily N-acetyltransferase
MAAVHVRSWRAGFAEFIADGRLPDADLAERTAFWQAVLTRPSADVLILLAEGPRGIIGVCLIETPSTDEDEADPGLSRIRVLYVDPAAWRTGAGRSLLAHARAQVRGRGQHSWNLWTLADQAATRAFYAAEGFVPDGGRRGYGDDDGVELVRLSASLLE